MGPKLNLQDPQVCQVIQKCRKIGYAQRVEGRIPIQFMDTILIIRRRLLVHILRQHHLHPLPPPPRRPRLINTPPIIPLDIQMLRPQQDRLQWPHPTAVRLRAGAIRCVEEGMQAKGRLLLRYVRAVIRGAPHRINLQHRPRMTIIITTNSNVGTSRTTEVRRGEAVRTAPTLIPYEIPLEPSHRILAHITRHRIHRREIPNVGRQETVGSILCTRQPREEDRLPVI